MLDDYSGYRECHVHPDFLLVYKVVDSQLIFICTEQELTRIYLGETLFYTESVILNFLKWS